MDLYLIVINQYKNRRSISTGLWRMNRIYESGLLFMHHIKQKMNPTLAVCEFVIEKFWASLKNEP